jgi:5-methylcytosine-specific restriction endonuclease McrA
VKRSGRIARKTPLRRTWSILSVPGAIIDRARAGKTIAGKRLRLSMSKMGSRRVRAKDCDDLARQLVFTRDRYTCVRCGKTGVTWVDDRGKPRVGGIQWCHVHTRNAHVIRHDPDNALTLCGGCHLWFDGKNPPFVPHPKREWWAQRFPQRDARLTLILQTKRRPDYAATKLWLEWMLKGSPDGSRPVPIESPGATEADRPPAAE